MSNESSANKNSTNETSLAALVSTYWWVPTVFAVTLGTFFMGGSKSTTSTRTTSSSSNAALLKTASASMIGGGGDGHFLNAVPSALFPRARASQGSL